MAWLLEDFIGRLLIRQPFPTVVVRRDLSTIASVRPSRIRPERSSSPEKWIVQLTGGLHNRFQVYDYAVSQDLGKLLAETSAASSLYPQVDYFRVASSFVRFT